MLPGGFMMESLTELKLFADEIPEVCSRASESSLNKLQIETRTDGLNFARTDRTKCDDRRRKIATTIPYSPEELA